MKIGFIGLGIMGFPMAKNLIKGGYTVVVPAVSKRAGDMREAGAEIAGDYEDLAALSDVVITMLPDSPEVKVVILGRGGVIQGIRAGSVVVDMSSIAPEASQEIGAALRAKGAAFLDAPVSGGEPKARDGTLAIMAGGDRDAFETALPVLEKMGSSVTLVGGVGSGGVTKLANQIIVALNIAAVSEGLVLASKSGVDPRVVFDAIKGGLAGSAVMNAKVPLILEGNFEPGFRVDLHIKDLRNALDTADNINTPLPLTAQVMEILRNIKDQGLGHLDHSAIIRFYEALANHEAR